jgi:hypothetical protein
VPPVTRFGHNINGNDCQSAKEAITAVLRECNQRAVGLRNGSDLLGCPDICIGGDRGSAIGERTKSEPLVATGSLTGNGPNSPVSGRIDVRSLSGVPSGDGNDRHVGEYCQSDVER